MPSCVPCVLGSTCLFVTPSQLLITLGANAAVQPYQTMMFNPFYFIGSVLTQVGVLTTASPAITPTAAIVAPATVSLCNGAGLTLMAQTTGSTGQRLSWTLLSPYVPAILAHLYGHADATSVTVPAALLAVAGPGTYNFALVVTDSRSGLVSAPAYQTVQSRDDVVAAGCVCVADSRAHSCPQVDVVAWGAPSIAFVAPSQTVTAAPGANVLATVSVPTCNGTATQPSAGCAVPAVLYSWYGERHPRSSAYHEQMLTRCSLGGRRQLSGPAVNVASVRSPQLTLFPGTLAPNQVYVFQLNATAAAQGVGAITTLAAATVTVVGVAPEARILGGSTPGFTCSCVSIEANRTLPDANGCVCFRGCEWTEQMRWWCR